MVLVSPLWVAGQLPKPTTGPSLLKLNPDIELSLVILGVITVRVGEIHNEQQFIYQSVLY